MGGLTAFTEKSSSQEYLKFAGIAKANPITSQIEIVVLQESRIMSRPLLECMLRLIHPNNAGPNQCRLGLLLSTNGRRQRVVIPALISSDSNVLFYISVGFLATSNNDSSGRTPESSLLHAILLCLWCLQMSSAVIIGLAISTGFAATAVAKVLFFRFHYRQF